MTDLSALYDQKQKYNKLKSNINLYIKELEDALVNINSVSNDVKKCYRYDEEIIDLDAYRDALKSKVHFLKYTILNKINDKIREVNNDINAI